jgi:hypothetical protein
LPEEIFPLQTTSKKDRRKLAILEATIEFAAFSFWSSLLWWPFPSRETTQPKSPSASMRTQVKTETITAGSVLQESIWSHPYYSAERFTWLKEHALFLMKKFYKFFSCKSTLESPST